MLYCDPTRREPLALPVRDISFGPLPAQMFSGLRDHR